jgi:hypothetical protein
MNSATSNFHIVKYQTGTAFFPWTDFFVLGSLWAYEIPDSDSLHSLSRRWRWYRFTTLALVVIGVPLGIWFDIVWPCLAAGILVPLLAYEYSTSMTLPWFRRTGRSRRSWMSESGLIPSEV